MTRRSLYGAAGIAAAGLAGALALAAVVPAAAHEPDAPSEARAEAAGERLGDTIQRAIGADGPLLTADERALVERKCGYAPGSWDGFDLHMSDGVLHCSNGRRVDDPEVRAMMEAAGPRIGRRVSAVMESAEIRAAIEEVTREATELAMASIDQAEIARDAARAAGEATREALAEARDDIERARRDAARARREAGEAKSGRRRR